LSLCDKGILSLSDFSLLVIDEAHHTKKGHVFNVLMKDHYYTLGEPDRPKVLALTATACEPKADIDSTVASILEMARALASKLSVPTSVEAKATLEVATNLPLIEFKEIEPHVKFESWAEAFKWYISDVVKLLHKDGLPQDMLSVESCSKMLNVGTLLDTVDRLLAWASLEEERKPLQFLLGHLLTLIENCDIVTGFPASRLIAMSRTLAELKENWGSHLPSPEFCADASRGLAAIIDSSTLYKKLQDGSILSLVDIMSPRTNSLLKILAELVETLPSDATVMVFTTTRAACVALTEVINKSFRDMHGGTSSLIFQPSADYIIGECGSVYYI
jgi:ERCC4-related helicase